MTAVDMLELDDEPDIKYGSHMTPEQRMPFLEMVWRELTQNERDELRSRMRHIA